jgi:hypothetical protein
MKSAVLLCLFALVALACGATVRVSPNNKFSLPKPDIDWCSTCISFMGQAIDQILNIVANVGIGGGCADVCGYLPNRVEATVCDVLCEIVGIEAFVKLIDDVDPDPIFICEELSVCSVNMDAKAKINSVTVNPPSGQQGGTFVITILFEITNHTGTGELAFNVLPPAGFPFGDGELLINTQPGSYKSQFQFQANPGQDEPFMPGTYPIEVEICEGSCGSDHKFTKTLAKGSGSFKITQ